MAEKMKNIGITETVYNMLVSKQKAFKEQHNANKTFSQVIEDIAEKAKEKIING